MEIMRLIIQSNLLLKPLKMKLNQLSDENEELKKENEFLKERCNEYWKEAGLNNDYFE